MSSYFLCGGECRQCLGSSHYLPAPCRTQFSTIPLKLAKSRNSLLEQNDWASHSLYRVLKSISSFLPTCKYTLVGRLFFPIRKPRTSPFKLGSRENAAFAPSLGLRQCSTKSIPAV